MSSERIEQIAEREKAATPGEWMRCGGMSPQYQAVYDKPTGQYIIFGMADSRVDEEGGKFIRAPNMEAQFNNAEFIAHAREDIPWLLTNIKTALRYIRRHKEAGNNATLWHLARIEKILRGTDDGLPANAEVKGDEG